MSGTLYKDFTNPGSSSAYNKIHVRVGYEEVSYNAGTNKSTIKITSVQFKPFGTAATCNAFGKVYINNAEAASFSGNGNVYLSDNSWCTVSGISVTNREVQHNPQGGGTFDLKIESNGYSPGGVPAMGAYSSAWGDFAYATPETKSADVFPHTRQWTVSYNKGAYGAGTNTTDTKTYGTPLTLKGAIFTRTGYTQDGWSTSDGGSKAYELNGTYSANAAVTLYPHWAANSYTVTCEDRVDNASGTLLGSATTTKNYGQSASGADWGSDASDNAYYTGYRYKSSTSATVSGDTTVYRFFEKIEYTLSATQSDTGITVNITRTSSPVGGSIGLLYDGDTIYYNDVIKVTWAVTSGYMADTLTVNGVDVSALTPAEKTVTVKSDMTVVMTVQVGGLVYIGNQAYQIFIYDGANWVQYKAQIYDGANWVDY